ncbi:MAG: OmpA family protein [Planctomycetales bacterium]|nr:OmpA family protein [Planctomycetales bacterium]
MRRTAIGFLALGTLGAGCVSRGQYDSLERAYAEQRRHTAALGATVDRLTKENQGQRLQVKAMNALVEKREGELTLARTMNAKKDREWSDKLGAQLKALEQEGSGVKYDEKDRKLTLEAAVFFASGEASVLSESRGTLRKVAQLLRGQESRIHVVGHTDSDPVSRSKDKWPGGNWELSGARALSVLQVLHSDGSIPEARLSFEGRGEHDPVGPNDSPANKKKNRRVEIFLRA